jgi:methylmalonyl-CoA mutase cobalamin-binding subunit
MIAAQLASIRERGGGTVVAGRKFLVASADTHFYGKFVLTGVLRGLGAEVYDAGVDQNPEELAAALAAQPQGTALAVSSHNGQCAAYAAQLMKSLNAHRPATDVFIGGKLNAILPGESEPRDATELLRRTGVVPCQTIEQLVEHLAGKRDTLDHGIVRH